MKKISGQIFLSLIAVYFLFSCATIPPEERAKLLESSRRVKLRVNVSSLVVEKTGKGYSVETVSADSVPKLKNDTEKWLEEILTPELQKAGYTLTGTNPDIELVADYKESMGAANTKVESGRLSFTMVNKFNLELKLHHADHGKLYETIISSGFNAAQDWRKGVMETIRNRMKDILPFK